MSSKKTWDSFNMELQAQWKALKSSYEVKQILGLFCYLIPLILG